MGARGPKPKPSAILKKKGTFKQSRSAKNEYSPSLLEELPKPPTYFNKYAKSEYLKTGAILLRDGLLANIDLSMFESYCMQMGIYMEAQFILKKEGRVSKAKSGYLMPHPYVSIGNKALEQANKIAASFGISPSARTRVSATKQEEKPKNPILSMIPGKKGVSNG